MFCLTHIDNLHDKKFNLDWSAGGSPAIIYKFSNTNLINFPYKYLVVFPP